MKRRTKILIALGVLLALGGIVAWQWDSILGAFISHRVRIVTTSLPHCERVDVFHLNGISDAREEAGYPKPGEGFPIRAYGDAQARILGSITLNGKDAEALATMWRAQTFDWDFQKLCHSPAYGLRFYSDGRLAFETSLCFHCSNFYVTTFRGSAWWGFDSESPAAHNLLRRLQEIFPDSIPRRK